jgi:hypothetical protein
MNLFNLNGVEVNLGFMAPDIVPDIVPMDPAQGMGST